MNAERIRHYGAELHAALRARNTVAPLTDREPGITIDDAYQIQLRMLELRLADGDRVVGKKIGVTSKAVMDMVGVKQPDFGQLTAEMSFEEGEEIPLDGLIQPKAEAEIAFVLKRDLKGPGITATDVIRATDYVVPCFEIVDSRITAWKIKIQDTIADNASCGVYMLGKTRSHPTRIDLNLAGMVLERNGELFGTAAGAAVQGGPVNAVVWLANTLGQRGIPFLAGEVILSGSQSPLVPVTAGDHMRCSVGGIGSCDIRFAASRGARR